MYTLYTHSIIVGDAVRHLENIFLFPVRIFAIFRKSRTTARKPVKVRRLLLYIHNRACLITLSFSPLNCPLTTIVRIAQRRFAGHTCLPSTPCAEKRGYSILGITLTNLYTFCNFWHEY